MNMFRKKKKNSATQQSSAIQNCEMKLDEELKKHIRAKDEKGVAEYLRGATWINLYNCGIGDEDMVVLAAELANNDTIDAVYLAGNYITDEGATALAAALYSNSTITDITLVYNNISDEGAKAFSTALCTNSSITTIALNNNKISNAGGKALEKMLELNGTMMTMRLKDNKIDGEIISSINGALAANHALRAAKEDPRLWAISYDQLIEVRDQAMAIFKEDFEHQSMRDINRKIIIPECRRRKRSYALSKNNSGLMTNVFVSHSWDEPFGPFVDSILETYQNKLRKPNLWICAFGLLQGNAEEIKAQLGTGDVPLDQSPFVKALKGASSYLVVRNCKTDLCERIWCICEIMFAKQFGLIPHKTMVTGPDTFANGNTSCKDADSFDPNDKKKILAELTSKNSVDEIDAYIREFRAFGAMGSNATEKTSGEEETEVETTPAPTSEDMTYNKLLDALTIKVRQYISDGTLSKDLQIKLRAVGALGSIASKKALSNQAIEAETTATTESGGRTIVELSNEFAFKVRHEISEVALSTDEQMKALEILDSLESDLTKNLS